MLYTPAVNCFLLLSNISLYDNHLSTHLLIGIIVSFGLLINKATMNTHVEVFIWTFSFGK